MRTGCAFGVAPVLAAAAADLPQKNNPFKRQPLPSPPLLGHWKKAQMVGISTI